MAKINKAESCCSVGVADLTSCHVESILNIDERGQVVLPKDVREKAGVRPGDVITALAGKGVKDLHHLHEELARHRIGETVEIALWRDGRTLSLKAVLEEYR